MDLDLVIDVETGAGVEQVPVTVTADPATTVGDLRRALGELGLRGVSPVLDHRVRLAENAPLTSSGLRSGATLGGTLHTRRLAPHGAPEVAVVGGLYGGPTSALSPGGTVTVGRAPGSGLLLPDPEVSRAHLAVHGSPDGCSATVVDHGSVNGTRLREWRLMAPARLDLSDGVPVLGLGASVVAVRRPARATAETAVGPDGVRLVNRPPRIAPPVRLPELLVPVPPRERSGFRFPWLATLLPAILCGGLYLFLPTGGYGVYLLLMMGLSPVLALANLVSDRRSGRRDHDRARAAYEVAYGRFRAVVAGAATAEEHAAREAHPDPSELVARTVEPAATLWQRRRSDGDFLALRVGLHDRPARLVFRADPDAENRGSTAMPEPPLVRDVPLTVELTTAGVLGVAGPRPMTLAACRALVVQAATLHSPAELGIVLLTGRDSAADWDWLTWLPHTLPGSSTADCVRLVATDAAQAEARLAELRRLVDERTEQRQLALAAGPPPGRAMLLVLDGARRLRDLPGLAGLLATGPAAGVYALCLDADETALPDECGAAMVASDAAGTRATMSRHGFTPVENVLVDGLLSQAATAAARALAPLRPLGELGADSALPDRVRLRDLLDPEPVRTRWGRSPAGRSTTAVLGVGESGPVTVDLRRDGPHALVAGTSGAGKSELLQTLVTSLALANTPDALTFVLVDYKGGSAFAACADLPHCVGLVTDLDGHLVRRALDSLSAELKRREVLFAEAGAKDIEDFWVRTSARLPRLVIVVDEFASLIEELPEFVPGVVGIGMRGRSLGVHVVLATQRPGGVVSADMRANVNLRICLRVTSAAESMDVIDAPDAARIAHRRPGRAYLRTGHGELTAFQAARVGGPLLAPGGSALRVAPRRIDELGRALVRTEVEESGPTDLTRLVEEIRAAAEGLPEPARPWLEPLPEVVSLAAVPPPATSAGLAAAVVGLVDRPSAQAQDPFVLDLERLGCVAVAGAVRTGRSTALRTLAASLAMGASPADLHLYALDCGNQALSPLTALPQCGAVVDGDDAARTERLLALLHGEVSRRQRRLAAAGHGSLAEHRAAVAPAERLPYLVLLVDRVEGFLSRYAESDGGRLVDRLEGLLRTGPGVGVSVVLSCDRTGFPHRIASAVGARLVLRQATGDDAAAFGLSPRTLPRHLPPGRGVWVDSGEEVHVALLDPDPAGAAQAAAIERLGAALIARWDGTPASRLPQRLDPLPEDVPAPEAEALRRQPRPPGPAVCTPAVGGDLLGPVDVDLAEGGCFVVAGPQRSGRSTALAAIVTSLAGRRDGSLPVLVLAPRQSPLRELAGAGGLTVLTTDPADMAVRVAEASSAGPVAVVVDDGELLSDHDLTEVLELFARDARDHGSLLVAAATTEDLLANPYRGWLATARRPRCGLLLDPASHVDGEVFGLRLARSVNGGWPPGRALLVRRGDTHPVQIVRPAPIVVA